MSCKVIMITSCKGGVGKSTIAANLGYTLASDGANTLLIDLDLGNRCLDLILGLESRALYDVRDVAMSGIPLESAEVSFPGNEKFHFLPAPYGNAEITEDAFSFLISKAKSIYDYIIIDTPGDIGIPFSLACLVSDISIIAATHGPTAIRAAGYTAQEIEKKGIEHVRLIINGYDVYDKKSLSKGARASVIDIIDQTHVKLLGVVPYSAALSRAQERGELVYTLPRGNERRAFRNITDRLEGKSVILFDGFKKISRRKIM